MTDRRIDHTAIVVADLDEAVPRLERLYGARCTKRALVAEQRVEVAFLAVGDTQIELISPTDETSGVARYLSQHGESLHHVAVQVRDIRAELERLESDGVRVIDQEPRRGVHGEVAFVHPRGTGGVLLELVQNDR